MGRYMKEVISKPIDSYGISRIDDDANHTHAWRVSLTRHGRRYVKNFTDRRFGSHCQALAKAEQYRDAFIAEHPPISRKDVCKVRRSNNKSGVTGVCTYAKRYQRRDGSIKENWYWEASWPDERGHAIKVIFGVNTYGEEMARQMALRARQQGLDAVSGAFWSSERGVVDQSSIGRDQSRSSEMFVA